MVLVIIEVLTVSGTKETLDKLKKTYNARCGMLKNLISMSVVLIHQKTFVGILIMNKVFGVILWMRIKDSTFVLSGDALIVTQVSFLSIAGRFITNHISDCGLDHLVCQKDTGYKYRGNISVTKGGIKCQAWDADTPHNTNNIGG